MTTPETAAAPHSSPNPFASAALTVASFAVLFFAGAAFGLTSGFSMGWVAHVWDLGLAAQIGGAAAVAAYLVALYALCRLAGWGSRRQSGALGFALGFVTAVLLMIGYTTGGSIVISGKPVNYLFLFGSMIALAAGVVRSFVPPPHTTTRVRPQVSGA